MQTKTVYVTITRTAPGPVAGHTLPARTRLLPIAAPVRDRDWHRVRGTVRVVDRQWQPAEVQVRAREPLPAEDAIMARVRHSLTPTKTAFAITLHPRLKRNNHHKRLN